MKRICFLLFLINITAPVFAASPDPGIDIKHYTFELAINDSTNVIAGKAIVDVLFKENSSKLALDLVTQNKKGEGMRVRSVSLNQKQLNFTHTNDKLLINLDPTASADNELTFEIVYSGIPQNGLIIAPNKFGDRPFFGDNWPNRAHHWLPTVDHPSDKASVDFIVLAPPLYEVVANGIKVEESFITRKQKLTHWHEKSDIPTKVMVIGAARFAIRLEGDVQGIPIESWVYPQNRLGGFYDFAVAKNILQYFQERIGPYPFQKLANVQSHTLYGGMENASSIFYADDEVASYGNGESLIAHEIAHQWFGNSATEADWHHVWLSEGFANYFEYLYTEFARGKEAMDDGLIMEREMVIAFDKKNHDPIVLSKLPDDLMTILNVHTYQKASWVLHMLRREIGDDAFWRGIRKYYAEYQFKNAQTSDFVRIMEEVSGKELDPFFNQWLFQGGHPTLKVSWTYDEKSKNMALTIEQTQNSGLFTFPLEIALYEAGAETKFERLPIDKQINKFTIKMATNPAKIILDPHTHLLFEGNVKN